MDLVVVSLEDWNEVWRRNQHLLVGLLCTDPTLRVLFVEPSRDPLHQAMNSRRPVPGRGLRPGPDLPDVAPGALWLYEPTKLLPRRADPGQDRRWARGVARIAGRLDFTAPLLWVNAPRGAELLEETGWPTLYDITDDWLEADRDEATHARLVTHEDTLMLRAAEVVVCSPALERTKSRRRPVTLLRNAVDVDAVRRTTTRPADLPHGPVAVYIGTLHSDRLDIDLCVLTAEALTGTGALVLVGPNSLSGDEDRRLASAGVVRLGAKDKSEVPAYLQHADVLVVPHLVDDFTESLDPIKLYEYRAVGRPVISTPVSGFREAAGPRVTIVPAGDFTAAVSSALPAHDCFPTGADFDVPTWDDRVHEMRTVLDRLATRPRARNPEAAVPEHVRARLGHAAVQWLADEHGLDVLHIKGQALDPSLTYPGRRSTDADVLVRPDQAQSLVNACRAAGFQLVGRFWTSSPFEHSATLHHDDWGYVDVHRLYPGTGPTPQAAFDHLWRHRIRRDIAGHRCATPSSSAQIVLLVLHAARSINGGQATTDVHHAWHEAPPDTKEAVRAEVVALHAEVAFAMGTADAETSPDTDERNSWRSMTAPRSRLEQWRERLGRTPDLRSRLVLLARLPLVNTDHLAMQLGHRPSRGEILHAFLARARRGAWEISNIRRRAQ